MRRTLCTLIMAVLMNAVVVSAPKDIELSTRVPVASAPGTFNFLIRIEPNAANRAWCLEADGPRFYRGSCLGITDGTKEAILRQVSIKDVPAGTYTVTAWVCRSTDLPSPPDRCHDLKLARMTVKVSGFGDTDDFEPTVDPDQP